MSVLKAIRYPVHQRPALIKPTLIKSLNICQLISEKEGLFWTAFNTTDKR
jgi:hypothetical protein